MNDHSILDMQVSIYAATASFKKFAAEMDRMSRALKPVKKPDVEAEFWD